MLQSIIEEIQRRARIYHGGDLSKATTEYFRDHPEHWQPYRDEVAQVKKRAGEDPEGVNAEVHYRIEMVAHRDKLDLEKRADRLAAQSKVFVEDPALYKRYRAANTVLIGNVSLPD